MPRIRGSRTSIWTTVPYTRILLAGADPSRAREVSPELKRILGAMNGAGGGGNILSDHGALPSVEDGEYGEPAKIGHHTRTEPQVQRSADGRARQPMKIGHFTLTGQLVQRKTMPPGEIHPDSLPRILQFAGSGAAYGENAAQTHAIAAHGVAGAASPLPHGDEIQAAFGRHGITSVRSRIGGDATEASSALGARAYAVGDRIAFGSTPDLHTAAHEAAHVVQQRSGVALKDGVGQTGDVYERHADAVADAVVGGRSAEPLLDEMAGKGAGAAPAIPALQRKTDAEHFNATANDSGAGR